MGGKCDLFRTRGRGGRGRSQFLGDFFSAQKTFVCFKEAPKHTLCSLLTSDMLYIASNNVLKPALLFLVKEILNLRICLFVSQ